MTDTIHEPWCGRWWPCHETAGPLPVRCSGAMADRHDPGAMATTFRVLFRDVALCPPCADAAGQLGMIDRRTQCALG